MSREKEQFQQEIMILLLKRELSSRRNASAGWQHIDSETFLIANFAAFHAGCSGRQRQESCQQHKFSMNLPREQPRQGSPPDRAGQIQGFRQAAD